mgnify:CR=1 FL=1
MLFDDFFPNNHEFKRVAVRVRNKAIPAIREGHPWLFEDSIEKISDTGNAGDIAVIFNKNQKFVAAGLYDPFS